MTATLVQFSVEDGSPTITYAPFPDTFTSPNLTAGWNPFFDSPGFSSATVGATGSGTSFHITSLDGASFQIRWKGTGIQLLGNVTRSTYTLEIDGKATDASSSADPAKNILATINDLADTNHTLSLTMHTNQQEDPLIKFDKAIISAPPSPTKASTLNFTEQVVNETAFNFRGRWSFQNDSNPAHRSTTAGDSAAIQFTGTSFLLRGSTSPDAGRYSVTLDNITTSFSGRSSFTQSDSLLFFASGLDAEVPHNLEIVNTQGAALVLPVGGASVFSLVQTPPSTSSSTPSASSISASAAVGGKGLSTGTIAALVLAGILIFFIALSLLLYFLLYRPYRRRQQLLRREQAKDDQDAGSVLVVDVRPDSAASKKRYSDLPPVMAGPSRDRTSKRSGFARWKEEVEGGLGSWGRGALGIAFRHSDSSGRDASGSSRDYNMEGGYKSTSSSSYDPSGKGKGKGKGRESSRWSRRREKSLSPRFKLDLPVESEQTGSRSALASTGHPEPSVISSLEYLSSPSLRATTLPSQEAPPSPRRRPTHSRADSAGLLLVHGNVPRAPEVDDGYIPRLAPPPTSSHPLPPTPPPVPPPPESPKQDDRGSVRDYDIDDSKSILGDGSARIALRSLSPRTSEAEHRKTRKRKEKVSKNPSPLSNEATVDPPHNGRNPPAETDNILGIRPSSPLKVDLDENDPRAKRHSEHSRVRFEGDVASDKSPKGNNGKGKGTMAGGSSDPTSKATFRLTPASGHLHETSFLDFASSSEGSITGSHLGYSSSSQYTRSSGPSRPRTGISQWSASTNIASLVPPPEPQSRWSATTAPSSDVHHEASGGSSDSNFPFPTSLPASPYHPEGTFTRDPPELPELPARHPSAVSSLNAHPTDLANSNPTSPTSSVPISISDIHFRHSDTDDNGGAPQLTSGLPAHPPLPSFTQEEPYIVQRVLGLHTPSPSQASAGFLTTPPATAAKGFDTTPSPASSRRPSPGSAGNRGGV